MHRHIRPGDWIVCYNSHEQNKIAQYANRFCDLSICWYLYLRLEIVEMYWFSVNIIEENYVIAIHSYNFIPRIGYYDGAKKKTEKMVAIKPSFRLGVCWHYYCLVKFKSFLISLITRSNASVKNTCFDMERERWLWFAQCLQWQNYCLVLISFCCWQTKAFHK